jgi:hypothetical protein
MPTTGAPARNAITVIIIYDGLDRTLRAEPHETVQSLLERAMSAFSIHQNRHTLALFTEGGAELVNLQQNLEDAHVSDDARLLLRPSQVRGGE